jgi:beta-glucosidase
LSYGRFEYANLTVDSPAVPADGTVTVSVEVTNTADREADEVVQLYLHQRYGSASRPVRELKGFRRITLAAGASRLLQFPVGPDERRYWNAASRDWVTDASAFDVWVGGDSTAPLSTTFEVTPD